MDQQPLIGLSHARRIVIRPAIAEALRACGFTDREIAHLMAIQSTTMSAFMRGERPLPKFRQAALIRLVTILLEGIGSPAQPLPTKYAARAQVMRISVEHWRELAIAEFGEDDVAWATGNELANRMMNQLLLANDDSEAL
jgi:hypothetical protein